VRTETVLTARCTNVMDRPPTGTGTRCTGALEFRWGESQAKCPVCGAYCGIAVADWQCVTTEAVRVTDATTGGGAAGA
jgi:hypothetical protein